MRIWAAMLAAALLAGASTPAAGLSCTPGPYILFFGHDLAFLDAEARTTLDNAVANAGDCGPVQLMLTGHTDTSERASLARKRVEVVRDYLAGHGFPRSDIMSKAFGSKRPRVATAKGIDERQNRRVELTYGPVG